MSRIHEGAGNTSGAHSPPDRPANKIGIVEILLAAVLVYFLFQFEHHVTRVQSDLTPPVAPYDRGHVVSIPASTPHSQPMAMPNR
jgi:hypothetical protein